MIKEAFRFTLTCGTDKPIIPNGIKVWPAFSNICPDPIAEGKEAIGIIVFTIGGEDPLHDRLILPTLPSGYVFKRDEFWVVAQLSNLFRSGQTSGNILDKDGPDWKKHLLYFEKGIFRRSQDQVDVVDLYVKEKQLNVTAWNPNEFAPWPAGTMIFCPCRHS